MHPRTARPALSSFPVTVPVSGAPVSGATRRLGRASWTAALACALVAGLATSVAAAPEELTEVTSLVVPEGAATGAAVDLDGDYAIFTAKRSVADGSVVVAHRTGPGSPDWEQTALTAPPGVASFGAGVAIDATAGRAVVSALNTPAVFVYTLDDDGSWSGPERVDVTSPLSGRGTYGNIGERLDLDGDHLVVTAPNARVGTVTDAGAAYTLDLRTGQWDTYVSSDPRAYGIFGQAVAIEGTTLVASELQVNGPYPSWPEPGTFRLGRVQIFDTSAPAQPSVVVDYPVTEKTRPAAVSSTMPFGVSLAVDGGRVYVGAPSEYSYTGEDHLSVVDGANGQSVREGSTTQGSIYVFDAASGAQLGGKITAPAGSFSFGARVEVHDDALLASAYNLRPEEYGKGEVYVYDLDDVAFGDPAAAPLSRQAPTPVQRLRPTDTPDESLFGLGGSGEGGIVMSGSTAVVGSPYLGTTGTVTIFEPVLQVAERRLTVADTSVVYGEQATVIASTDTDGADGGEVVFTVGGAESAPVPVDGHSASLVLDAAAHDVGSAAVTATFVPTSGAEVTATATHTVTPASTTVHAELTDEETTTAAGSSRAPSDTAGGAAAETVQVLGTVATQLETVATGSVELWDGETLLVSALLDPADTFSATIPGSATRRDIDVRYLGDINHLPSGTTVEIPATFAPEPEPTTPVTPGPTTPADATTAPTEAAATATETATETASGLATTGAPVLGPVAVAVALLLAGLVPLTALWVRRRAAV